MNNLAKTNKPELSFTPEQDEASALIAQAIDKNVPVETMEKLLSMRRELKAEWAKKRFNEAMASFQMECPVIKKDRKVDFTSKRTGNRTTYSFAPLDSIVGQVKDILSKNGFSYVIQTKNNSTAIISTVIVHHVDGHTETTDFEVPIDKESFMNSQQQYGSASTFSKRYAFCNAFGILTGDEDNDAKIADKEPREVKPPSKYKVTPFQIKKIFALIKDLGVEPEEGKDFIKKFYNVDSLKDLEINQASDYIKALEEKLKSKQSNTNLGKPMDENVKPEDVKIEDPTDNWK